MALSTSALAAGFKRALEAPPPRPRRRRSGNQTTDGDGGAVLPWLPTSAHPVMGSSLRLPNSPLPLRAQIGAVAGVPGASRKADDFILDEVGDVKRPDIIAVNEEPIPEWTGLPPLRHPKPEHEVPTVRETHRETSRTATSKNSVLQTARPDGYVRIKDRVRKSPYELGPNEVLLSRQEVERRQQSEEADRWHTLVSLHEHLSHIKFGAAQKKQTSHNRVVSLRSFSKRKMVIKIERADGADDDSSDDDDPEGAAPQGSLLAMLSERSHYLARLYESLYRACPTFMISRNQFVSAIRSFAVGLQSEQPTDLVTIESATAAVAKLAWDVATAFGNGEDMATDWRTILCSLRMVSHARHSAIEHLRWFFLVYASQGVLEIQRIPPLPVQSAMAAYTAAVESAKQEAIKEEVAIGQATGRQVRITPAAVPFPHFTPANILVQPETEYPNLRVDIFCIPTIVGILCGTQQGRWAAEQMVGIMMSHPYFEQPPELQPKTLEEIKKQLFDEVFFDKGASGVSFLRRRADRPGALFFRHTVTLKDFDDMIMRDPIAPMLLPRQMTKDEDAGCEFETMYHPVLRQHITNRRFVERVGDMVRRTAARWRNLQKAYVVDKWKESTTNRKFTRYRLDRLNELVRRCILFRVVSTLRRLSRMRTAAIRIQSAIRRYQATVLVQALAEQTRAATMIQKAIRTFLARRMFFRMLSFRYDMVVRIQKTWRGRMGRLAARRELQAQVRAEYARLRQAKRAWRKEIERQATLAIQACWRGHLGRKAARARRQELADAKRAENEMAAFLKEQERLAGIAAAVAKQQELQKKLDAARAAKDREDSRRVRAVQFRRKVQKLRVEDKEFLEKAHKEIEDREATMRASWKDDRGGVQAAIKERVIFLLKNTFNEDIRGGYEVYCERHHLEVEFGGGVALSATDEHEQKRLFAFIMSSAKKLQADVKEQTGSNMRDPEARATAIENYIIQNIESTLAMKREAQKDELEVFRLWKVKRLEEEDARREVAWDNMRRRAATMIQRAFRRQQGWWFLVRMMQEVYVRVWDESVGGYYYLNTKTGESKWDKPMLLGSFEPPVQEPTYY